MSLLRRIVEWLPRDMSLPEEEFRSRHLAMTVMLLLHVPALFAYGYFVRGFDVGPLALELAFPLVAAVLGALPMVSRRIRMFAVTTGLVYSSVVLLHLSGGAAESSLHFLIVLAFVFLYREWFLFIWSIVLMGASHALLDLTQGLLGGATAEPATPEMALWALMTAACVASVGLILAWKSAQDSQQATVAALATAKERDEAAARRDAYGKMYVNLARRSQSLVDRQLTVIDELEEEVQDPDILSGVFELDHLTTRVRRHGESLLVVADVDLPSRTNQPVALSDVIRGAQSEIEQYRRVDAQVDASIAIHGPATRDLVHLLAELLDNATTYSPPSATVQVHARAGNAGAVVVTVEDRGLGLTPERLAQANRDLRDTDALDEDSIRHLGFRVVARLAAKHDITIRLTSTNGGGVTAWVELPPTIVASADHTALAPARLPDEPVVATVPDAPPPVTPERAPEPAAELPRRRPAAAAEPPAEPPADPPPSPDVAPQVPAAVVPPVDAPVEDAPVDTPSDDAPVVAEVRDDAPLGSPDDTPSSPTVPAPNATPEQLPASPPATADLPAPPPAAPTPAPPPPSPPAPSVVPAPMSAGFSANGRRRRGRRGRSPVSGSHDRSNGTPPTEAPRHGPNGSKPGATSSPPPVSDGPVATGAVGLPQPGAPEPSAERPAQPTADAPPLPRRERGATSGDVDAAADEEALDLFGELDDGGGRSTLGDFQRGQESARRETRR